jgi:hypothetical protein
MLAVTVLVLGWLVLCIPGARAPEPVNPHKRPFGWNDDSRWFALEERFRELRAAGCGPRAFERIDAALVRGQRLVDRVESRAWSSQAPLFDSLEASTFALGPMIGACPQQLGAYIQLVTRTRSAVKRQSEHWDVNAPDTRDRMYRLLFGGRAALEEVMLQDSVSSRPALVLADDEPSQTPFTRILGVTIHSGDLLVSRAGAQISALIAVGNDYAGNFSHVAIVYVDEKTSLASVIESRPNTGVAVHPLEAYLADVKLRVMVLRLRADLPALVADPMLPHKAAALMLADVRRRRIPYDAAMDLQDDTRMYCSEVPSTPYGRLGVHLWMGMSSISSPGVIGWLSAMGVRHFEPQEPSDLEYDPQVRVVAEWRDPGTLFRDHVDNVVTEAMLRRAQRGAPLTYPWYLLPLGRLAKFFSAAAGVVGFTPPIPDGMSGDAIMRVLSFQAMHYTIKQRVLVSAEDFRRRRGYVAPEWDLLAFAKQAAGIESPLRAYVAALRDL